MERITEQEEMCMSNKHEEAYKNIVTLMLDCSCDTMEEFRIAVMADTQYQECSKEFFCQLIDTVMGLRKSQETVNCL